MKFKVRRQIDSLSINVAHQQTFNMNSENNNSKDISNHTYKIRFCEKKRMLLCRNQQNSKWDSVNFVDTLFYNQLIDFCEKMIEEGYLLGPLFFLLDIKDLEQHLKLIQFIRKKNVGMTGLQSNGISNHFLQNC